MANKQKKITELALVDAIIRRSVAAVFALRTPAGVLMIRHQELSASWPLFMGLAVQIQSQTAQAAIDNSQMPSQYALDVICARYRDQTLEDLDLATTDHLLAELYRLARGDWVLGFFRHKRKNNGHYSGVCWNGTPIGCVGLGGVLVQTLQAKVYLALLKTREPGLTALDETEKMMLAVKDHAGEKNPSWLWMTGVLHMAEHTMRETGSKRLPGDDLRKFVSID